MSGPSRVGIGRRRFVQLMGWAGAAAVAHGGPALSAAAQKAKASSRPPRPAPTPPADTGAPISEEAKLMAQVAQRRHGGKLSPEQVESIARDIDGDLKSGQRLRDAKLANSDEPDTTFRA